MADILLPVNKRVKRGKNEAKADWFNQLWRWQNAPLSTQLKRPFVWTRYHDLTTNKGLVQHVGQAARNSAGAPSLEPTHAVIKFIREELVWI